MKKQFPVFMIMLAMGLTACSPSHAGESGDSGASPSGDGSTDVLAELGSDTAMVVDDDVELEFRQQIGGAAEATEDCLARNPSNEGLTTAIEEGPDEPTVICRPAPGDEETGVLFRVELSPAIVTGENVEYIDFDYGTAGMPMAYVVLDDEGASAWHAVMDESYQKVEILVDGRPLPAPAVEISNNDILNISALSTIEEAEQIARTMAQGFDQ